MPEINALDAAAALDGTEVGAFDQGVATVKVTTQEIADLAQSSAAVVDAAIITSTVGTSSTAEATAATLAIPAGAVTAETKLRLTLFGTQNNNSGSAVTFTTRLKLNGTTVFTSSHSKSNSGNSGHFRHVFDIDCSTTAAQKICSLFMIAGIGSTNIDADNLANRLGWGPSTVDLAAASTLTVTFQSAASSAAISYVLESAVLERLGPT